MNNNADETIEQKVFRLGRILHGKDVISFDDALHDNKFILSCQLVALAIAEEREACKAVCVEVLEQNVSASSEYKSGRQMGAEVCFNQIAKRELKR